MDRRTFLKSSGAATIGGIATTSATAALAASEAGTRTLRIASSQAVAPHETTRTVHRLSDSLQIATNGALECKAVEGVWGATGPTPHIYLAYTSERRAQHPAWTTLMPLINGFSEADFSGWLATGGGTTVIEQLEAETQEKIFLVGAQPAPHGIWADRELFGLHPRPSLTIRSGQEVALAQVEQGSGDIELQLSDGLVADLEADRFNRQVLHALPAPLAGDPLILSLSNEAWMMLSAAEQGILSVITAAEHAQSRIESQVAQGVAKAGTPLPTASSLPGEFRVALAAAIEDERQRLSSSSPLAMESLASQTGYRTITGANDLAQISKHFSA